MTNDGGAEYQGPVITQAWTPDRTAKALGLDLAKPIDDSTQYFVDTVNLAQNLWENIHGAARQQGFDPTMGKLKDSAYLRATTIPAIDSLEPSLGERYWQADRLVSAALETLTDGYGDYFNDTTYVKREVTNAVVSYGLKVVEIPHQEPITPNESGIVLKQIDNLSDNVAERFEVTANRLGIPKDQWNQPTQHQLIGLILGVENLLSRVETGFESPVILPKRGYAVLTRYQSVAYFTKAIRTILEQGLGGQQLSSEELQQTLNEAIKPFDVGVIKEDQPKISKG